MWCLKPVHTYMLVQRFQTITITFALLKVHFYFLQNIFLREEILDNNWILKADNKVHKMEWQNTSMKSQKWQNTHNWWLKNIKLRSFIFLQGILIFIISIPLVFRFTIIIFLCILEYAKFWVKSNLKRSTA